MEVFAAMGDGVVGRLRDSGDVARQRLFLSEVFSTIEVTRQALALHLTWGGEPGRVALGVYSRGHRRWSPPTIVL